MLGRWGRSDGRLSGPKDYAGPRVRIPSSVAYAAKQLFKLPARYLTKPWGYKSPRVVLGLMLLVAASLKTHQLATEPVLGTGLLDSRWLLAVVVEFELLLGLCLLANVWPRATWAVALSCFSLFTCVSLYKAISGHTTCGCFGRVAINPWYTGILDFVVVCSLIRCRPRESLSTMRRALAVLVFWFAIGFPVAYEIRMYHPSTLAASGIILGDGNLVILEPEKWVGNRFPLLPYIEDFSEAVDSGNPPLRERLRHGHWCVVLSRHGCPRCEKLLTQARERFEQDAPLAASRSFASVETSSSTARPVYNRFESGRLAHAYRWFHRSPLVVHLKGGVVEYAFAVDDGS